VSNTDAADLAVLLCRLRFICALLQLSKGAASEAAKFGRSGVELLSVVGAPRLESVEPAAEAGELIRRQLGDCFGDLFDFHAARSIHRQDLVEPICTPIATMISRLEFRTVLADNQYPIAECEALVGVVRDSGIQRGMADSNARSRRNDPPNVLVMAVP